MFYVVPGKKKKKKGTVQTVVMKVKVQPWGSLRLEKDAEGFFFFLKKEDARYVHIMLSSGICNFKAASTRESRVTIFKVITQMSYEWYLLFEHIF